jgi:hypothetical protein
MRLWGDGIHDDTQALQAVESGIPVGNRPRGKIAIWNLRYPSGGVQWMVSCPLCPACRIIYRGLSRELAMREAAIHWSAIHDTRTSDARASPD